MNVDECFPMILLWTKSPPAASPCHQQEEVQQAVVPRGGDGAGEEQPTADPPGHGRGLERPDYLLQITNDAWFGTFSGPYQHLDQARFRAIEQGLPFVRVANTGVSAVIDANGRIVKALGLGVAGYVDVAVPEGRSPTLYSRTGDFFAAVVLLAALSGLLLADRRNAIANGRIRQ